jgi:hypothetical protein
MKMKIGTSHLLAGLGIAALAFTFACGGGGSSSSVTPPPASGTGSVQAIISDDPTEDWATIGVKVLSISLVPQGGGTAVPIYTAPSPAPTINLVQLDQLGEIIGNVNNIQAGTYASAQLTLGANNDGTNCDVTLIASGDPESGFDVAPGATVPCSQIVIVGAQGTAPNMTVPLTVNLKTPLTVTANSSNALDLEFDLRHPALIVEHADSSGTVWAVNFSGPVRHHPRPDLSKLVLRHLYGTNAAISSDNSSITVDRLYPYWDASTNSEAETTSTNTVTVAADATNGTLFYNFDGATPGTPTTIYNFQNMSTLSTQYLRIAARYQQNGTLTATRIYASSTFSKIWNNPEGHVLHVNTNNNTMWVTTEDGKATHIAIGPNTNFYFGSSSNTAIGVGTAFFDGSSQGLPNVARGFKVTTTIDPASSATPPVALSVEIQVARYDGTITSPTSTGFNYTRKFAMADARGGADNYSGTLDYISGSTANTDQEGNSVQGFYWWDFAFPTTADTSANPGPSGNPVTDFVNTTSGSVNFGGNIGALRVQGLSNSIWDDPAATDAWAARWTILMPVAAPLGAISSAYNTSTNSFTYTAPLATAVPAGSPAQTPVTVDLTTTSGSATLVYQVDHQPGKVVTVTPQDISNSTTLQTVAGNLTANTPVKVYGVPQSDGSIKAYVLFYYTGVTSTK